MTKQRSNYLYELVGVINKKTKTEPKEGSKYQGSYYWRLKATIENQPEIKSLKVFQNSLENSQIWTTIESNNYLGKRYRFTCKNWMGNYYLINWEELGNSYSENKENHD